MVTCAVKGCPLTPKAKVWMDGEVIDHLCTEHGKTAQQFLESIDLSEGKNDKPSRKGKK